MSETDAGLDGGDTRQEKGATGPTTGASEETVDTDTEELLAEVELLRAENRRLRESYVQAKTTQYRRVAVGLGGLGLMATVAAVVFPTARTVLLALGATGLFTGLLTDYLTPERFAAADIGAQLYETIAANQEAICTELGLEDERIYVPTGEAHTRVTLFVPHDREFTIPDDGQLESTFVVTDDADERGVAFEPTGNGLFSEFERAVDGSLGDTLPQLLPQLREGLVEQFEIADAVAFDAEADGDRVTVELQGDIYEDASRFDHPTQSFIAVGLARGLDSPIRIARADGQTSTVTFRRLADRDS
jgi:hypothetical protein